MVDAPLAVGFAAGMLATFNPCGFAMLPAYLSFFVGGEGSATGHVAAGATQALRVGAAVTAGFVAVFGAAGLAITGLSLSVQRYAPWATLVIGLALVPLGLAVAAGRGPRVSLPRLQRGGSSRGLGSMAVFGVSYATVSLSCTLPVFLAAVSTTFRQESVAAGLAVFVAYAAGMGAVLTSLAVVVALARQSMIRRLRGILPHVERASGLLLAAAGAYVAWYGWVEVRLAAGADVAAGPVDTAGRLSGRISTWISETGATRLGLAAAAITAVSVIVERRRRRAPRSARFRGPRSRGARRRPAGDRSFRAEPPGGAPPATV